MRTDIRLLNLAPSGEEVTQVYHYSVIEERLYTEELGEYTSFGLLVSGAQDLRFSDVSPDREFVSALATRFNELQLSPTHLSEVIQDLL